MIDNLLHFKPLKSDESKLREICEMQQRIKYYLEQIDNELPAGDYPLKAMKEETWKRLKDR